MFKHEAEEMEKIDGKTPRDDDESFLPTLVVHCNEICLF